MPTRQFMENSSLLPSIAIPCPLLIGLWGRDCTYPVRRRASWFNLWNLRWVLSHSGNQLILTTLRFYFSFQWRQFSYQHYQVAHLQVRTFRKRKASIILISSYSRHHRSKIHLSDLLEKFLRVLCERIEGPFATLCACEQSRIN